MPSTDKQSKEIYLGFGDPTYTPFPDDIVDLLLPHLNGAELKVLLYICRRTYGFKKQFDAISLSQMVRGITTKEGKVLDSGTGLGKTSVVRALTSLEEKGIILRDRNRSSQKGDEATTYSLRRRDPKTSDRVHPVSQNGTGGVPEMAQGGVPQREQGVSHERNTQETVRQDTVNKNDDVVNDRLLNFGISPPTAKKIVKEYPEEYVADKLAWAEWLLSKGEIGGDKGNAAGWLSDAIKGDFKPTSGYETPSTHKARTENQAKAAAAEAEKRRKDQEEFRQAQEEIQKRIRDNHPPQPIGEAGHTTASAWTLTLKRIQPQISPAMYQTWLKNTMLISMEGNTANIVVPNQDIFLWIVCRWMA